MTWVWDHSQAGGTDRLVLLAIADSADHDGANAWPSVSTIARKCQVSERTVQRSIRSLVDLRELAVEDQAGGTAQSRADRRPNRYRVLIDGVTERHPETDGVTPGADGVTTRVERGDTGDADGVTIVSPEPPRDPSIDPSKTRPSSSPGGDVDPAVGFEVFWSAYPRRNGKRVGKAKALAKWKTLSLEHKRAAYRACQHYAAAIASGATIARDPERFLANSYFEDWLDGPGEVDRKPSVAEANLDARDEFLRRRGRAS